MSIIAIALAVADMAMLYISPTPPPGMIRKKDLGMVSCRIAFFFVSLQRKVKQITTDKLSKQ